MNSNALTQTWSNLCPPAQIYPIVMTAVILFNIYRGTYKYALSHFVIMLIGTTLLWVLCAARMDFVAYSLLILPVLFFVFLLALIFYDQSLFDVNRKYNPSCPQKEESTGTCASKCC